MNSIQRRLSIGLASIVIIVGIVVAQTSLWLFDQGLRRYLETHLRLETETLLSALVRGDNGIELRQQRISSAYDRPFSGHYFNIHLQGQNWRSRSAWDHPLTEPATTGLQARLADGPAGQELLLYRGDFRRFGQNISITVASDYLPMLEIFRNMAWIVAGLGASALLALLVMQRILVANALKPLDTVREQIAQLQQGQRSQLDTGVPVELLPLVQQINHLLQHTEDSLKRSRHALGNLGHALKTPLSVLLGLSNRDELQQYPELNNSIKHHLEQIRLRINRELGRARLAGEALPGAYFDCAREIPDLLATLAQIHQRPLAIEWRHPSSLRLPWDREDILEMLGNVLDNACKWAVSRVELDIADTGDSFLIHVDDDGPGLASQQHRTVLTRGKRADEHTDGHGLGLAIVRDIVENCHGEISLDSSALGGLRVTISLPARP